MTNREIKFRAWDKKNKKMCPVLNMNWLVNSKADGITKGNVSHVHTDKQRNSDPFDNYYGTIATNLEIMQYTGLKDKKGDEDIYEGDIIKTIDGYSEVKFLDGCFVIHCHKFNNENYISLCEFIEMYPKSGVNIIGNIYENEELLK